MKIIRVLLLLCCFMAETMLAQNVTIKGHIGDFSGKLKLTVSTGELRSSHEFCSFYINTPDFEVSFESPTKDLHEGSIMIYPEPLKEDEYSYKYCFFGPGTEIEINGKMSDWNSFEMTSNAIENEICTDVSKFKPGVERTEYLATKPYTYYTKYYLLMFGFFVQQMEELQDPMLRVWETIPEEEKKEPWAIEVRKAITPQKEVAEGMELNGSLQTITGENFELSSLRGKFVLLDFWGSTCEPCIVAIPEITRVAEANSEKLQVVSITTDNDTAWRSSSAKHPFAWINAKDLDGVGGLYSALRIHVLPTFVLIGPDGKMIAKQEMYGTGIIEKFIADHL